MEMWRILMLVMMSAAAAADSEEGKLMELVVEAGATSLSSSPPSSPSTAEEDFHLRVVRTRVADVDGAGMDGGSFGFLTFGGGAIKMRICDLRMREVRKRNNPSLQSEFQVSLSKSVVTPGS